MLSRHRVASMLCLGLWVQAFSALAVTPSKEIVITHHTQVLEILAPRTRQRELAKSTANKPMPSSPGFDIVATESAVRELIELSRQTQDPRFLGRAQARLGLWWTDPEAPANLLVLKASIEQSRHEFSAARMTLTAALKKQTDSPMAWLTLASLDRLAGRYSDALVACTQVSRFNASFYGQACNIETQSLLGESKTADVGFASLLKVAEQASQRAWILSLQAEHLERFGREASALKAYRESLKIAPDVYTALAYSDALLRTKKPSDALLVLTPLPDSDAVLIRRARAYKALHDDRWKGLLSQLQQQRAEQDQDLHARETAMVLLWLEEKPREALQAAQRNLLLQKEPIDWWLALQCATAVKDIQTQQKLFMQWKASGMHDQRITALQNVAGFGAR